MTYPIATVNTFPYCGACGWVLVNRNLGNDVFCDSCGGDFSAFMPVGLLPAQVGFTQGSGQVTFTWTANPAADSEESSVSDDGLVTWSAFAADTPDTVVSAVAGTVVGFRLRSILGGVEGPVRNISTTTGV